MVPFIDLLARRTAMPLLLAIVLLVLSGCPDQQESATMQTTLQGRIEVPSSSLYSKAIDNDELGLKILPRGEVRTAHSEVSGSIVFSIEGDPPETIYLVYLGPPESPLLRVPVFAREDFRLDVPAEVATILFEAFVFPYAERFKSYSPHYALQAREFFRNLHELSTEFAKPDDDVSSLLATLLLISGKPRPSLLELLQSEVVLTTTELEQVILDHLGELPIEPEQYLALFDAGKLSAADLLRYTARATAHDEELTILVLARVQGKSEGGDNEIIVPFRCWDLDRDHRMDLEEDLNGDNLWNVDDCLPPPSTDPDPTDDDQVGPEQVAENDPTSDEPSLPIDPSSDPLEPEPLEGPILWTGEPPGAAQIGLPFSYRILATSTTDTELRYAIVDAPAFLELVGNHLSGTPAATDLGSYDYVLVVTNGSGGTLSRTFHLTVVVTNAAPLFTSTACLTTAYQGLTYRCQLHAEDADGDGLSFVLVSAPTGMTLGQQTGELLWTPGPAHLDTQAEVVVEVRDQLDSDQYHFILNVVASLGDSRVVELLGTETLEANPTDDLQVAISEEYTLDVAGDVASFGFTITGQYLDGSIARDMDLYSLLAPDGQMLLDPDPNALSPIGPTNARFPGQPSISLVVPNSISFVRVLLDTTIEIVDNPSHPLQTGHYRLRAQSFGEATEIAVHAVTKRDADLSRGTLHLNVFLVGQAFTGDPLDKLYKDGDNTTVFAKLQAKLAAANLDLVLSHVEVIDDVPAFQDGTLYIDATGWNEVLNQRFADLLELSSRGNSGAVSVFMLQELAESDSPEDSILGYSAEIPGALINGTSTSGLVVTTMQQRISELNNTSRNQLAFTIAHELGHYLGLYHTSENFDLHDPLPDTPECTEDRLGTSGGFARDDCAKISEDQEDYGAANLMFPFPALDYLNLELTPQQRFILQVNPWVR